MDEVQIDTDMAVHIPDNYVNNIEERLKLYQRLGAIATEEELQFFELELEDRFGPLPHQEKDLLYSVRIKWLAKHIGFTKLIIKMDKLIGHFAAKQQNTTNYPFSQPFSPTYSATRVRSRSNKKQINLTSLHKTLAVSKTFIICSAAS